jgi:hypothetical protein
MRPHGRADISATKPRALGVCQRCGFLYNHDRLQWQFQYGAMRLINLRILVCQTCLDQPQIQLRTILLPPDPVPIEYPVPENYQATTNPLSANGFAPRDLVAPKAPTLTGTMNIGTINGQAGMDAVWDGNTNKQSWRSATQTVSNSSYQNFVGKYWDAVVATNAAQTIVPPVAYNVSSFTVTAPSDQPLLKSGSTGIQFQGSNNGVAWTVLYSTTTPGTNGEVITSTPSLLTGGNFQYHRIAIQGDGATQVAVAQVAFTISNTGQNEQ